jgi:tetratricopeptide (TPR) repeat protein
MPENRLENLRRRVEADPTSIAFAALAEEYRRLGRFQDAVDVCRRGLERHPAYLSARVTLGRALVELGQLDAASRELEQVRQSAPENLAAIRALADIHGRRRDIPETVDASFESVHAQVEPPTAPPPPVRAPIPVPTLKPPPIPVPAAAAPPALAPAPKPVEPPEPSIARPIEKAGPSDVEKRLESFLGAIVAERRRREPIA